MEETMASWTLAIDRRGNRSIWMLPCLAIALILVSTSMSMSAVAQSADKVLKQATKAHGGEKALGRVNSWRAAGTIKRRSDGAQGKYEALATRLDLYTINVEIGGFESSEGFNGKSGWRRDSREGLRTLTGAESIDFRAEAAFRNKRWLDYKKDKAKVTYGGPATLGDRATQTVILTTARNVKIKMYFDAASGLLVKEEIPSGETVKRYEYSDYRAVDEVQEPFAIVISDGAEQFQITLSEVTHNPTIARSRFDFPIFSGEPLPDIAVLLKEVSEHQDEVERLLENYTYTQTITSRELDKNGAMKVKEVETYELTFYRGRRLRRLVAKNGQPLSTDDQAKEDKRIEKMIREIENKEAEKEKKERSDRPGPPEDGERPARISDVLRASKLTNPRGERFRGREVIVFDFEPLPGYKPQKQLEKLMGKMAGAIWVDAEGRQAVRVEARLVDSYKVGGGLLGAIKQGAAFVLEQNRVNNEIWLPTYAEFNLSARALFFGINFNSIINYGDYKRFNVNAEKERLKDPTKP
jgi:hypothetical protein